MPTKNKKRLALSESEQKFIDFSRDMQVYKSNEMIQKGRHKLSVQEQRCVLFAISKIKPTDTVFQEYTFDLSDFYKLCGLRDESYTELKSLLVGLKQKTWWIETAPGEESTVSWFNKVRTNKNSGTVTVRFDDDMMPYLLNLAQNGGYYTHYELKWVLPMTSQYSIPLYELLKSYQRNNLRWYFDLNDLKERLSCTHYKDYCDFRRRVLEPALSEINRYTDFYVTHTEKKSGRGGRVSHIEFFMKKKNSDELQTAMLAGSSALDGTLLPYSCSESDV